MPAIRDDNGEVCFADMDTTPVRRNYGPVPPMTADERAVAGIVGGRSLVETGPDGVRRHKPGKMTAFAIVAGGTLRSGRAIKWPALAAKLARGQAVELTAGWSLRLE